MDSNRIKVLSAFIRECEDMLQAAKGLPDREQSILKRLNNCKRNLDIILAEKISGTVRDEAAELKEQIQKIQSGILVKIDSSKSEIIDHIRRPVVCAEYKTSWQVIINRLQKIITVRISQDNRANYKYALPNTMYELFLAISQIDRPTERRAWITLEEIIEAVPSWQNINLAPHRVIKEINMLRDKFGKNNIGDIIESRYKCGYRLSTPPENIIEEAGEISKDIPSEAITAGQGYMENISGVVSKNQISHFESLLKSSIDKIPIVDDTFKFPCLVRIARSEYTIVIIYMKKPYKITLNDRTVLFDLFHALAENCKKSYTGFVSDEILNEQVWNHISNVTKVHISKTVGRLRNVLADKNKDFSEIIIPGDNIGYKLDIHPANISIN